MLFEELYPNILSMTPEDYLTFFQEYRAKRHKDLIETEVLIVKKKRKSGRGSSERKVPVTPEQLKLLKEVGLL